MGGLSKKERLKILEMVSEIASEAAQNPSVAWTAQSQKELVETLYETMIGLVDRDDDDDDDFEDEEDEGEEEGSRGR